MTILFGHPTGNPNAHHSALAHFEAGRLEAFCVPWFPSSTTLRALEHIGPLRPLAKRLGRRYFTKLVNAPKIQGRLGEFGRLAGRVLNGGDERLSYQANDWLMGTMREACRRPTVTAVHSFEDCSLWQFAEAKRLGKACIYDMPIGYYPAWERTLDLLSRKYADWLPAGGLPSSRWVRPEQKRQEMNLADLVLVPGSFVEKTIRAFHPEKITARAAYGVDLEFWNPKERQRSAGPLRFIYAGQLSLRKGIPHLLEAWEKANISDASLELVGSWQLAETRRLSLPRSVNWRPPCSTETLRERYRAADVLVFPSFFEGFALVLLEAMACGLPAIASEATAADVVDASCGQIIPTGNVEALVESLRWFKKNQEKVSTMSNGARIRAKQFTWENYRRSVTDAVASFV